MTCAQVVFHVSFICRFYVTLLYCTRTQSFLRWKGTVSTISMLKLHHSRRKYDVISLRGYIIAFSFTCNFYILHGKNLWCYFVIMSKAVIRVPNSTRWIELNWVGISGYAFILMTYENGQNSTLLKIRNIVKAWDCSAARSYLGRIPLLIKSLFFPFLLF